ncbi:hypothetical protein DL96DRAFT_1464086 [Flagelloscypha sp. PMI_526]|nr:hypothetical protein DL96DRAFT_1464086 [Flagelloscypha sp. PMI_526]
MSSSQARKKSIVSTAGLVIDTPVANNTLLNQAASQSTSLYQQCSSLRNRLARIKGFGLFFDTVDRNADPVTFLWDLFSQGLPLCYLFDLLDGFPKINQPPPDSAEIPDRAKKHAIALFAIQIRSEKVAQQIPGCELFTVTDLWDRKATDGLVKVVKTVTAIVGHLPPHVFEPDAPSTPFMSSQDSFDTFSPDPQAPPPPANAQEAARNNIVREIVETERKYVQDLEIMQKYANALSQGNVIGQDTIHLLFPNLNKLLNFQRKFLIRLEGTAEQPWVDQHWGQHFLECEEEFNVYEPYCANYTAASDLMLSYEQNLSALNHLINVKGELPAFLIKPIQRVCKYPLLLDSLIKASNPANYPHYEELKAGSDASKRITDTINEAQRRAENELTVQNLKNRVDDWKGHHLENFGDLLLDDVFIVTKSDIDREYHVFLFEKIILCCKEAIPQLNGSKKSSKNNSILKKQPSVTTAGLPNGQPQQRKNTPLLLKGRIFLGNVTQAVPVPSRASTGSGIPATYPLAVWWKGDDDLEYFTLRCRREDQMRQWESQINRLIRESAVRRASDRSQGSSISTMSPMSGAPNSTNPRAFRQPPPGQPSYGHYSSASQSGFPSYPNGYGRDSQYRQESSYPQGPGPNGYPPHGGFEFEPDEDDYEDYPSTYGGTMSGRGTPMGRRGNAMSMPAEQRSGSGYDRPRANTEDTNGPIMAQWRSTNGAPPPPPGAALPMNPAQQRPSGPGRINSSMSNMSGTSYTSDASFGNEARRPQLRSKFSTTRLNSAYDDGDQYRRGSPAPSMNSVSGAPLNRSRSASQPQAYVPKQTSVAPPLPNGPYPPRSTTSMGTNKRSSGSSQDTGDSSDYSPAGSSPITPFGSSDGSLSMRRDHEPPVKVKVHFHEDIFVIQVSRLTEYDDLVEKVGKKIRLCGPRRDDGPLRVKYRDEDGDMVSLGSTEDVQMAFEQFRPGGQVTLYVT